MREVMIALLAFCAGGVSMWVARGRNAPSYARAQATGQRLEEREADFARAVAEREQQAFTDFWTEDAVYLGGPGVVSGREAIVEELAPLFVEDGPRLSWTPSHSEASACGDLGFTFGDYSLEFDTPDGPQQQTGRYTTIWRREPDGVYRVVLDGGRPDPPPPAASSPQQP